MSRRKVNNYEQHIKQAKSAIDIAKEFMNKDDKKLEEFSVILIEREMNLIDDFEKINKEVPSENSFSILTQVLIAIASISGVYINIQNEINLRKIKKIEEKVNESSQYLNKAEINLNKAKTDLDDAKTKLNETESKILTHVITLLGIFTAIITVIVTAISTTTSWLNNANEVSFTIAIIIPVLVTIIAIGMLLFLMDLFVFSKEKNIV